MFSCACGVLFSTVHHNSAIIQAAYMYDMQAIIYAVTTTTYSTAQMTTVETILCEN